MFLSPLCWPLVHRPVITSFPVGCFLALHTLTSFSFSRAESGLVLGVPLIWPLPQPRLPYPTPPRSIQPSPASWPRIPSAGKAFSSDFEPWDPTHLCVLSFYGLEFPHSHEPLLWVSSVPLCFPSSCRQPHPVGLSPGEGRWGSLNPLSCLWNPHEWPLSGPLSHLPSSRSAGFPNKVAIPCLSTPSPVVQEAEWPWLGNTHSAPRAPASPPTRLCPALLLSEGHWSDWMRVHPRDLILSLLPLGFISRCITCVDGRRRMSRCDSGDTTQPRAAGSGSTLECSGAGDTYPGSALSPSRC